MSRQAVVPGDVDAAAVPEEAEAALCGPLFAAVAVDDALAVTDVVTRNDLVF